MLNIPKGFTTFTMPEKMKIKKCHKLACNLFDKNKYIAHTKTLKQALNLRLILKKVHRIIKFSQKPWLKTYIDMSTKLKTEAKHDFEKRLF